MACICEKRKTPFPADYKHPTLGEGEDPVPLLDKHGYFVVRNVVTQEEVAEILASISDIIAKWLEKYRQTGVEGNDWEEVVNRRPAWKDGTWEPSPGEEELGVRRLFRMAVHHEFFARMARHEKILKFVNKIVGPDVKLLQSMALMKPPGGIAKDWHQDNAYFRLTPFNMVGVWIALDRTDCSNGCMHFLPSAHKSGFYKHGSNTTFHIDYLMVDRPQPDDVIPVHLNPGDCVVFSGLTPHYTPPNVTDTRRRSLQYHYASSLCKPIKCPKGENGEAIPQKPPPDAKPGYFDCDPICQEPEYWYFRKGEILVSGKDYGGEYI